MTPSRYSIANESKMHCLHVSRKINMSHKSSIKIYNNNKVIKIAAHFLLHFSIFTILLFV